jgi:hypothetical protein
MDVAINDLAITIRLVIDATTDVAQMIFMINYGPLRIHPKYQEVNGMVRLRCKQANPTQIQIDPLHPRRELPKLLPVLYTPFLF